MSVPPRVPGSFRYFKAKLLSLSSPAVWMPALVLTLMGAFVLEYLSRPPIAADAESESGEAVGMVADGANPDDDTLRTALTDEELRQAAELDNLDVLSALLAEEEDVFTSLVLPDPNGRNRRNAGENGSPSAGDRFLAAQQAQAESPAAVAPAAPLDLNTLPSLVNAALGGAVSSGSLANDGATPISRSGGSSPAAPATSASPGLSPLQQALDRTNPALTASPPAAIAADDRGTGSPNSAGAVAPPPSSYSAAPLPSYVPTTPNMSPPPGTTGYTPPPALVSPAATGTNRGNAYTNLVPQPQPGNLALPPSDRPIPFNPAASFSQGTPPVTDPQSLGLTPVAPPFSAPRRAPGQYIGNGEFNTFSNP